MLNLGVINATTGESLGRHLFTTPPQNGDVLEIEGVRYRLQRVWDDAGGLLLEAQNVSRSTPSDLLEDIQYILERGQDDQSWRDIQTIIALFKRRKQMLESLGWLFVLVVLALSVIPSRIGRFLRECRLALIDLVFIILVLVTAALWLCPS